MIKSRGKIRARGLIDVSIPPESNIGPEVYDAQKGVNKISLRIILQKPGPCLAVQCGFHMLVR